MRRASERPFLPRRDRGGHHPVGPAGIRQQGSVEARVRELPVGLMPDPEAPIVTLNQRQPRPRVFPIIGDLFETVPAFTAALQQEEPESETADLAATAAAAP